MDLCVALLHAYLAQESRKVIEFLLFFLNHVLLYKF